MLWRSARHCWQITVALLHHGGNFEVRNFEETWCFFPVSARQWSGKNGCGYCRFSVESCSKCVCAGTEVSRWLFHFAAHAAIKRSDELRRGEKRVRRVEKSREAERSSEKSWEKLRRELRRALRKGEKRWERVNKSWDLKVKRGEKRCEKLRRVQKI